jgi:hypothetical protein|tara:strand:+ start:2597 stop:3058 length:462 start_codon:yes stop_codon:yes gene_type:complete
MVSLLKWWLIFCLVILGTGVAVHFNVHNLIYDADVTKLSFLIISIFFGTSIWIGNKTYKVEKYDDYDQNTNVGWFIAESCLALGMVGTVTGFLLMLGTAFSNIDVSNSASLQTALEFMAVGMSTALYTTLVGLICSLIIKVQLVNLEVAINEP